MVRKLYYGPVVDVSFDGAVCRHAGECVRGMPTVFDVRKRPWIDPGKAADEQLAATLREVVARCPSGALQIEEHPLPE